MQQTIRDLIDAHGDRAVLLAIRDYADERRDAIMFSKELTKEDKHKMGDTLNREAANIEAAAWMFPEMPKVTK